MKWLFRVHRLIGSVIVASCLGCATPSADVTLQGRASDDGTLTTLWQQVGGPVAVHIQDPTSLTPEVTFTVPGVYTFRLTADDGELTSSDEMQVTVEPKP